MDLTDYDIECLLSELTSEQSIDGGNDDNLLSQLTDELDLSDMPELTVKSASVQPAEEIQQPDKWSSIDQIKLATSSELIESTRPSICGLSDIFNKQTEAVNIAKYRNLMVVARQIDDRYSFVTPKDVDTLSGLIGDAIKKRYVLHECVFRDQRKISIDIDCGKKYLSRYDQMTIFRRVFKCVCQETRDLYDEQVYLYNTYLRISDDEIIRQWAICSSSSEDKLSLHLVFNGHRVKSNKAIRQFLLNVKERLGDLSEIIDMKTSNKSFNLRLIGTSKGKRQKLPLKFCVDNGLNKIEDYLIQPQEYVAMYHLTYEDLRHSVYQQSDSICHDDLSDEGNDGKRSELIAIVNKMTGHCLTARDGDSSVIYFNRVSSGHCPICKRTHDSDGMSVSLVNGAYWLNCNRQSTYGFHGIVLSPNIEKKRKYTKEEIAEFARQHEKRVADEFMRDKIIVDADEMYNESSLRPYPTNKSVIAVQCACGVGKSVALRSWLSDVMRGNVRCKVIALTHRRSFGREWDKKCRDNSLNFASYRDVKDKMIDTNKYPMLTIQFESLHRLDMSSLKGNNVILVLDEFCSVVCQTESHLGKYRSISTRNFDSLLTYADKVIALDAYHSNDSVSLLEKMTGRDVYTIVNQYKKYEGMIVNRYKDPEQIISSIIESLRDGKKITCSFSSRTKLRTVEETIKRNLPDKIIKTYHGKMDDNEKLRDFDDIESAWNDADCVMYTSTIEVGVSFELKNVFSDHYAIYNNLSITYIGALQMMYRNRDVKTFHICIEKIGRHKSRPLTYDGVIEQLSLLTDNRMKKLPDDIVANSLYDFKRGSSVYQSRRLATYIYHKIIRNCNDHIDTIIYLYLNLWGMTIHDVDETKVYDGPSEGIYHQETRMLSNVSLLFDGSTDELTEIEKIGEKDAQTAEEKTMIEAHKLCQFYGLTQMNEEQMSIARDRKLRDAVRRMRDLQSYGSNITDAMSAIKKQDMIDYAGVSQLVNTSDQTGRNDDMLVSDINKTTMRQGHIEFFNLLKMSGLWNDKLMIGTSITDVVIADRMDELMKEHKDDYLRIREMSLQLYDIAKHRGKTDPTSPRSVKLFVRSVLAKYGLKMSSPYMRDKDGKGQRHYSVGVDNCVANAEICGLQTQIDTPLCWWNASESTQSS